MFTLKEYVERNGLGVDQKDTYGLKMVAAHLRTLGYEQTRVKREGKQSVVWIKKNRQLELEALAGKLAALEKKGK